MDWRPSGHFTASVDYELDVVRLEAGGFNARIVEADVVTFGF